MGVASLDDDDWVTVRQYVGAFAGCFGHDPESLLTGTFSGYIRGPDDRTGASILMPGGPLACAIYDGG